MLSFLSEHVEAFDTTGLLSYLHFRSSTGNFENSLGPAAMISHT